MADPKLDFTLTAAGTVASLEHASSEHHTRSLSMLAYFDTMFLIDDSSHMKRQWQDVSALIKSISPVCLKYDDNGIDIYFVNHRPLFYFPGMGLPKSGYTNIGKKDTAQAIFDKVRPGGSCKLGARLRKIFNWYLDQLSHNASQPPLNIIVITAGISSDDFQSVLVDTAMELDSRKVPEHQLGVQLFQVGEDQKAREAFEYADDELHKKAGTRDMVDTVTWRGWPSELSPDDMVKSVLGAVSKRLDKQSKDALVGGKLKPKAAYVEDESA